ncbi:hypothetical protein WJ438_37105 [Streptomyces sp. GD-15H]|uniref:hypothetical protein n=1 Tax=Streptomyces sp. GD-15H TaxID=3129112 RepID=UPI00324F03A9
MIQRAAAALFEISDEAREETITFIEAVAGDSTTEVPDLAAAFGEWCWLVYTRHGEVVEVLDAGCAR